MSARDALARLRRQHTNEPAPRELQLSRRHARLLIDMQRPGHNTTPLDYALDDDSPPFEARPMFGLCEWTLIFAFASSLGSAALWFGSGG